MPDFMLCPIKFTLRRVLKKKFIARSVCALMPPLKLQLLRLRNNGCVFIFIQMYDVFIVPVNLSISNFD